MRGVCLFRFVVLFAASMSVNAMKNEDLMEFESARRVSEVLRTLFPVNIVKQISNARSSGLNRTIGAPCNQQLALLEEGLTKGSIWAMKMIDASSKIPSGILMLNQIDFGMFDECVGISVNEGGQEIRGRHCMYSVLVQLGGLAMVETLSSCLPGSCEAEDVEQIIKSVIETIPGLADIGVSVFEGQSTCTAVDPPEWTAGGIVTLIGFSLLLLFLVGCTICDISARYSREQPVPNGRLDILRQFSLYSNAVRVLSTKTSPQTLPALQGLRFFSMCWVIMGHRYMMMLVQGSINLMDFLQWIPTWDSLYIMTAPFSVDSFFTISGFLMSYLFLKEMSTGRSFSLFSYYLHRYLRLTPAFAAMILITIFISPHLGSGPAWEKFTSVEVEACRETWWTKLLYLHNYVNTETNRCLGHTWYLAVEMQFFWISPLILYPLAKTPKIGLGILGAFFVASVTVPVIIGYENKYSTAMISNREVTGNDGFMENFYIPSHIRAAPWLIGMFFGYLVFTQKGSSARKETKWIGWLLTIVAFSFCIFTMRIFEGEDYTYDDVWEGFYTALARPLWGFAVSWVIYACVRGFGGAVSTFLSFSIYTPLSRISYCIYLVHYQIQMIKGRSARMPSYFSDFNAFDGFLSDLLLSIMFGFVFTIIFESPILVMEKIVKKHYGRTKDDSKKLMKVEEVEKGSDNPGFTSN